MADNDNTTEKLLKELCLIIRHDNDTGYLYWNENAGNKYQGRMIGKTINKKGYRKLKYKGAQLFQHRVIFFMYHGFLPEFIDHIDGNGSNNKIENIRACTIEENNRNSRTPITNTSGYKGVYYSKQDKAWIARIRNGGNPIRVGYCKNKEDAAKAVAAARKQLHGEYANHG